MNPEKLMGYFLANEGTFDDETLLEFKRQIFEESRVWMRVGLKGFLTQLTREAWAKSRTESGSPRQIFYAQLAAFAEGVYCERFHVEPK